MRSSWIKRWHHRDESGNSNGNTTETSLVREECQDIIDAGQAKNLDLHSLEEKDVGDKVVSNHDLFVEADNATIHVSDSLVHGGHKNTQNFSHDLLLEENMVNDISKNRENPHLGETSCGTLKQEEERLKSPEEPIKFISGKPPPLPPWNKRGLPPRSIVGKVTSGGKLTCDFSVTNLQSNSTNKLSDVGMEKDLLKPGSSHMSKVDDTSACAGSFSWENFPGPSKWVKEHSLDMSQVASKVHAKEIDRPLKLNLQTGHIAADTVQEASQCFQLHKKSTEDTDEIENIDLARGEQCNLREDAPKQLHMPLRYTINDLSVRMEQQEVINSRSRNLGQRQGGQVSDSLYQLLNKNVYVEDNGDDLALHNQKRKGKAKVDPASGESSKVVLFYEKSSHNHETASSLGKRLHKNIKANALTLKTEKGTNMKTVGTSHIWIQRWHPSTSDNDTKSLMSDASVFSVRNNLTTSTSISTYSPLGLKKFKDNDGYGLFSCNSREVKSKMTQVKGQLIQSSDAIHTKTLPSPAAMAIVGTAARQFCSSRPHRTGSFAFWSGFGMPLPQKVELQKKI